mmetsp:Transcript_132381/g.257931  ORF Transcript_132381/g.257931 Transcript_132381/m.257931 type:complete len:105 (+) Transcript_132381:194-508(+)
MAERIHHKQERHRTALKSSWAYCPPCGARRRSINDCICVCMPVKFDNSCSSLALSLGCLSSLQWRYNADKACSSKSNSRTAWPPQGLVLAPVEGQKDWVCVAGP